MPALAFIPKRRSPKRAALLFLILTATRSGEVRGATWDEFDLHAGIWSIPAHRMKAKESHRVPLSEQALTLVKTLKKSQLHLTSAEWYRHHHHANECAISPASEDQVRTPRDHYPLGMAASARPVSVVPPVLPGPAHWPAVLRATLPTTRRDLPSFAQFVCCD